MISALRLEKLSTPLDDFLRGSSVSKGLWDGARVHASTAASEASAAREEATDSTASAAAKAAARQESAGAAPSQPPLPAHSHAAKASAMPFDLPFFPVDPDLEPWANSGSSAPHGVRDGKSASKGEHLPWLASTCHGLLGRTHLFSTVATATVDALSALRFKKFSTPLEDFLRGSSVSKRHGDEARVHASTATPAARNEQEAARAASAAFEADAARKAQEEARVTAFQQAQQDAADYAAAAQKAQDEAEIAAAQKEQEEAQIAAARKEQEAARAAATAAARKAQDEAHTAAAAAVETTAAREALHVRAAADLPMTSSGNADPPQPSLQATISPPAIAIPSSLPSFSLDFGLVPRAHGNVSSHKVHGHGASKGEQLLRLACIVVVVVVVAAAASSCLQRGSVQLCVRAPLLYLS